MKKLFWDFKFRGLPLIIYIGICIGAVGFGVLVGVLEEKTGLSIEIIKDNSFLNRWVSIGILVLFLVPIYFLIEYWQKKDDKK